MIQRLYKFTCKHCGYIHVTDRDMNKRLAVESVQAEGWIVGKKTVFCCRECLFDGRGDYNAKS